MASRTRQALSRLHLSYPWTSYPIIIGAPMRILSGPHLAVSISNAGGIGFIGPGAKPSDLEFTLQATSSLIKDFPRLSRYTTSPSPSTSKPILPIGIGFQTWAGDLSTTLRILSSHPATPSAVWLFAPRHGQPELDEWASAIRSTCPGTQIWIQAASLSSALAAAQSSQKPDVLVIQGHDAGGHSLTKGAGIITLLPEVADALAASPSTCSIPLVAAGGIIDARGFSASLTLGAAAAAMGTRFLCTPEAKIATGYQRAILAAKDGGQTTVRTQLYNHLRGTMDWPEAFDARGVANASWRDHAGGMAFEENKKLHEEAMKKGEDSLWGEEQGRTATYAGTGVGLVRETKPAAEIVQEVRDGVMKVLETTIAGARPERAEAKL